MPVLYLLIRHQRVFQRPRDAVAAVMVARCDTILDSCRLESCSALTTSSRPEGPALRTGGRNAGKPFATPWDLVSIQSRPEMALTSVLQNRGGQQRPPEVRERHRASVAFDLSAARFAPCALGIAAAVPAVRLPECFKMPAVGFGQ